MQHRIREAIATSIKLKQSVLEDDLLIQTVNKIVHICVEALVSRGRIFFCGNGGSAADAQHLAAELSGRYYFDRPPLDAEALNVNMSYITAVGNDYGYNAIFKRSLQAKGRHGDVLFGLSTSGNSENIISAFEFARANGITTIAMTGKDGGRLLPLGDFSLHIPSGDTPRIQECHMLLGHVICELIEKKMFA